MKKIKFNIKTFLDRTTKALATEKKKKHLTIKRLSTISKKVYRNNILEPLVVKTKEQAKRFNAADRALAKLFCHAYDRKLWKVGDPYYVFVVNKDNL